MKLLITLLFVINGAYALQLLARPNLLGVTKHGFNSLATIHHISHPAGSSCSSLRHSTQFRLSGKKVDIAESFGKGLARDIKNKLPHYPSDFTDSFNAKTLASTFFLFFACLAPAIAFGSLLAIATGGAMGTVEAVGATAIGGVIYALFSAQPITIIGITGPLLAFLKVVYSMCLARGIPFLPVYAWIGLWSSLLLFISSFFSLSNLVEYLTKFTDDIFSALISVIFIVEAVKELAGAFTNPAITGLQATISLLVAMTTFTVATTLSKLRQTPFFPRKVRNLVSDFAPTIGVASGVAAARFAQVRYSLALPMLAVPKLLSTTSGRPWLVDIFAVSNQVKLLCLLPALTAFVLLYMDQNITVRLVVAKENKLKKGSGFHLDMFVVAAITALTSVLGMPWMVASTVPSLAHLRSLQKYRTNSDGDGYFDGVVSSSAAAAIGGAAAGQHPLEVTGALEQRGSGVLIHALIGGALLNCRHLLRQVPVSVLTGLFLYLGTSSINKTELWERAKLFITDSRDAPRSNWLMRVGLKKTKLFTGIQLALLAGMFYVKGTRVGVLFPALIGLLGPVRTLLEKKGVFSKVELEELDGELD